MTNTLHCQKGARSVGVRRRCIVIHLDYDVAIVSRHCPPDCMYKYSRLLMVPCAGSAIPSRLRGDPIGGPQKRLAHAPGIDSRPHARKTAVFELPGWQHLHEFSNREGQRLLRRRVEGGDAAGGVTPIATNQRGFVETLPINQERLRIASVEKV
jgi:hypothetical protein